MIDFCDILDQGWIQSAQWFPTIDSTNSQLKREIEIDSHNLSKSSTGLSQVARLPRLLCAGQQTSGRGRGDHAWWSPTGCLMSSVAIPADSTSSPFISYRVAIAVAETIESQLTSRDRCKIKWPNDVYVDDKKIAGILIEQVLCCSRPIWIIGTGINIDVDFSMAPPEVQARAISLRGLQKELPAPRWTNDDRYRDELMTYILGILVANLGKQLQLMPLDSKDLKAEWSKRCFLTGKMIEGTVSSWFESAGRNPQQANVSRLPLGLVNGICQGIDENGHLLIQHESGSIGRIITGSVRTIESGTT